MIFISKNETGEPAWELVLRHKKTVTRRMKPIEIGKSIAVQPGRGKFAVGRVKITGCVSHIEWWQRMLDEHGGYDYHTAEGEAEAEGFISWLGLMEWFNVHKINIDDTYRIEFELLRPEIPLGSIP